MYRPLSYLLTIAIILLCAPGCTKFDDDDNKLYDYTITNTLDKTVQFNVYGTEEGYLYGQNALQQFNIAPGASVTTQFIGGGKYYFDWYSSDYDYNNWAAQNSIAPAPATAFLTAKIADHLNITHTGIDTSRSILLPGNQFSSRWKVFPCPPMGTTTTPYREFVFRKDFTVDYTYVNTSGDTVTVNTQYAAESRNPPNTTRVLTLSINKTGDIQYSTTATFTTLPNAYPHTTRDSMMINFYEPGGIRSYYFVRQ